MPLSRSSLLLFYFLDSKYPYLIYFRLNVYPLLYSSCFQLRMLLAHSPCSVSEILSYLVCSITNFFMCDAKLRLSWNMMCFFYACLGIFVALALRFDVSRGRNVIYFGSAFLGYTAGLVLTIVVMNWFQAAQVYKFFIRRVDMHKY